MTTVNEMIEERSEKSFMMIRGSLENDYLKIRAGLALDSMRRFLLEIRRKEKKTSKVCHKYLKFAMILSRSFSII